MIIYVDQPGKGGDRDTYEMQITPEGRVKVDVGHTFVEIVDTDTGETTGKNGLYPANPVDPSKPETEGKIGDDEKHDYDVKKEYPLTDKEYEKGKEKIKEDKTKPPKYNLNNNNCTDWGLQVAEACGKKVKTRKGKWPGGEGRNPGDLGEDLAADGGERKKPAPCPKKEENSGGDNGTPAEGEMAGGDSDSTA